MIKRVAASLLVLMLLFGVSACKDNENSLSSEKTTVKETRLHNYFSEQLPEFSFDNEVTEEYNEGFSYILRVNASEKECLKYIEKLKKADFVNDPIEADAYYAAKNGKGYFVEVTYIEGMLTVFVKKV